MLLPVDQRIRLQYSHEMKLFYVYKCYGICFAFDLKKGWNIFDKTRQV